MRKELPYRNVGQGLFDLAMKHIYGNGVSENNELALELLTQAHELGHVEATYNLGSCYHYGCGSAVAYTWKPQMAAMARVWSW